jgi:hypothetical protein
MPGARKRARADDRRIINAILVVMLWRDIPERCEPYTTNYSRFTAKADRAKSAAGAADIRTLGSMPPQESFNR